MTWVKVDEQCKSSWEMEGKMGWKETTWPNNRQAFQRRPYNKPARPGRIGRWRAHRKSDRRSLLHFGEEPSIVGALSSRADLEMSLSLEVPTPKGRAATWVVVMLLAVRPTVLRPCLPHKPQARTAWRILLGILPPWCWGAWGSRLKNGRF